MILIYQQKQVKQKRMSSREYRSAAKGESWKFRLMNAIDQCMRYASTKEDFISLMESEGYQVRWTGSRKSITYTTPEVKTTQSTYTKTITTYKPETISTEVPSTYYSTEYSTFSLKSMSYSY